MSPVWHVKIEGWAPLNDRFRDGNATLDEVKNELVDIVKRAVSYVEGDDLELDEALENLADARDTREFDEALSELYDWADRQRVWIDPVK